MQGEGKQLLSNASATGSDVSITGGKYNFVVEATFGGGTVKLQAKTPQGTYVDVASGSLTANGMSAGLDLSPGLYRANVATATAVYAWLSRVPY